MMLNRPHVRSAAADGLTREILALRTVETLAADPIHMQVFLDESGLDVGALRSVLDDPALQGGLLDHVLGQEALLVALSATMGLSPDATVAAIHRIRPPT